MEKEETEKEEKKVYYSDIEERKKKIIQFFKQKTNLIFYGILAFILLISAYIRTRNIPRLKDITTGTWTLGPDLDPFLFLRWAQYIAEHGKLFAVDMMRYVPLANICSGETCAPINTAGEMNLLSYMIAWFSKFLMIFDKDVTVTYAAIIFPVIMAVLTGIAFFLFARKLFNKENKKLANIIALVSTAIFVLIPSLLPRTIAGIPEKESAAFFFIFLGAYFFLEAFSSETMKRGIIYSLLAVISTVFLGLIWGGAGLIFIGIALAVLIAFLLGKIDRKKILFYSIWTIFSFGILLFFSERYTFSNITTSSTTGLTLVVLFILVVDFLLFKNKTLKMGEKIKEIIKIKIPNPIISLIIALLIGGILVSIIFGFSFIIHIGKDIISNTVNPITQGRFSVTVAENKQPFFTTDWASDFGPVLFNIPIYFWLFFIGSVFLFYYIIKPLAKKDKIILTISYILLLAGLIFSKYSNSSILNGTSTLSMIVYFGGAIIFLSAFIYVYSKKYREDNFSIFKEFNFSYIFYFIFLMLAVISARGAIRLILVLGAISPIAVGFLIVKSSQLYLKEKEELKKLFAGIAILIILLASLFTVWTYYRSDINMAENYAPNFYTQQWQKAMAWVRDNTSLNSVFAHWWDYGYWLQSIGQRATILDGGNAIGYWNFFMGRNVLTGTNEKEALDFLYAHNGTHLLIDSSDIGKYGAFSSIGSDEDYDRYSWIPTIFLDDSQTRETNNETLRIYPIGTYLDEDSMINYEGKDIMLPQGNTAVAAIATRETKEGGLLQPIIFFVYNGKQYSTPLRYEYKDGKLYDFNSGFNGGIFIFSRLESSSNGGMKIIPNGAALYLSNRVIDSRLTRLYLFNEKSDYFKLIHTEESLINTDLKNQGVNLGEFVYYPSAGLQGPIKIWEIKYPAGMNLNESYLSTDYPPELETVA